MIHTADFQKRFIYFCATIILFGFIVFGLKKDNHFYGLNETSDLVDCIFYVSITFSTSGYANIYPQTPLAKIIILLLSVIKLVIIIYPLEALETDSFVIPKTSTTITIDDIDAVLSEISNQSINLNEK
tara:strand:+ start:36 stop:419 length:384 start_codon:yes stop_codon:yes gene_type:complete